MKVIEESLDRLIQRIKLTNEILDSENQIRFIKAYKEQYMESPVSGFLVAVGLDDLQINNNFIGDFVCEDIKGKQYIANVTFKVFAPDGTGGNGLSEVTNLLCKAIVNADTEGLVDSTKVSAIEYDNSAFTVFRTITLVLDFCLYEEVSV